MPPLIFSLAPLSVSSPFAFLRPLPSLSLLAYALHSALLPLLLSSLSLPRTSLGTLPSLSLFLSPSLSLSLSLSLCLYVDVRKNSATSSVDPLSVMLCCASATPTAIAAIACALAILQNVHFRSKKGNTVTNSRANHVIS